MTPQPSDPTTTRTTAQVKKWADELIDLSMRNPAINHRGFVPGSGRAHRASLRVVHPAWETVHALLARSRAVRFFLPPPLQPGSRPLTVEDCVARARPDELVTDRTARKDVEDTLKALHRNAVADETDKGLQTLYLCFGMLAWREAETAEELRSPLVLVPVLLERDSRRRSFTLRRSDGDALVNPSLGVKLAKGFAFALPEVDPDDLDDASNVAGAFEQLRATLPDRSWRIEPHVVLRRVTFHKQAMYQDLIDNLDAVAGHPLVRALASPGDGSGLLEPSGAHVPDEDEMDEAAPPERANLVLDADASQRRAVHAAVQGVSFVMDGPPGTGKSQTIANMIAALVAAGRTVLFVAEKAAALQVVARRLMAVGLDDFLFQLYDSKVSRKEVAQELGRALALRPLPRPVLADSDLEHALDLRQRLSGLAHAMNEVREPLGRPLSWVLGRLAQLEGLPAIHRPESVGAGLGAAEVTTLLAQFEALARRWAPVEQGESFPWHDLLHDWQEPSRRGDVERGLELARTALHDVWAHGEELGVESQLGIPGSLGDVDRLVAVLAHAATRPPTHAEWWSRHGLDAVERRLRELEELAATRRAAVDQLASIYGTAWRQLPVDGAERLATATATLAGLQPPVELAGPLRERLNGLRAVFEHGAELATALAERASYLAEALGAGTRARTVRALDDLAVIASHADEPVRPRTAWAQPAVAASAARALDEMAEHLERYREQRARVAELFEDGVYERDLDGLARRFRTTHTGMGRLRSGCRSDRRLVASVARGGKASKTVLAALPQALEAQRLGVQVDQVEDEARDLLGRFLEPRGTDVEAAREALARLRDARDRLGADYHSDRIAAQLCGDAAADPRLGHLASSLHERLRGWLAKAAPLVPDIKAALDLVPEQLGRWARSGLGAVRSAEAVLDATEAAVPGGPEPDAAALADQLQCRALVARLEDETTASWDHDRELLGEGYSGPASRWDELRAGLRWTVELRRRHGGPLPRPATARLHAATPPSPAPLEAGTAQARRLLDQVVSWFQPTRHERLRTTLEQLGPGGELLGSLRESVGGIEILRGFRRRSAELHDRGFGAAIDDCAARAVTSGQLKETLERALYAAWFDAVAASDPRLSDVTAEDRDALVASFRSLDSRVVNDAAERVTAACASRRPATAIGPTGIILREAAKKRRHMPVRRLLGVTGDVAQATKPCFMMSPLTVSQLLPRELTFDVVIFDEASQVRPSEAANCIYRAEQVIVAGDDKQLPPTPFFMVSEADDEDAYDQEQLDEFESILDACKATANLRSLPLRWHYRSQHEPLISFSNQRFYGSRLVTFPSATIEAGDLGIELFQVGGSYVPGARRNPVEAREVAERVRYHARRHPDRSIGVVAFNQPQAELIQDEIETLEADDPALAHLRDGDRLDGLFVKNLESVQGDERDVVIFSVGYGPDQHGKLAARFGALNRKDGWRRLNVAVTRARRRVEVVSSVSPGQMAGLLDGLRADARGVRELAKYLDYADRGLQALAVDGHEAGGEVESPLEASVLAVLESWGYQVVPQVGSLGYRIDLAIRDPNHPGRYALAVECDGAAYHASKVARDRDRLRQEVLERQGWRFHRVWGTSWYRNRNEQERKLREAVDRALAPGERVTPPPPDVAPRAPRPMDATPLDGPPAWAAPYQPYFERVRTEFHPDQFPRRVDTLVRAILQQEAPVCLDLLAKRVGQCWGLRATQRVRDAVDGSVERLRLRGECACDGTVVTTGEACQVRIPDLENPRSQRAVGEIPPVELDEAVRRLVADALRVPEDELIRQVSRVFGWDRTGANIQEALERSVARLLSSGQLARGPNGLTTLRR